MRPILISIVLCMGAVIWSANNIAWSGEHHAGIIKADGRGYYAHLPATFIYNDLNFQFFDSLDGKKGKYYNQNYFYDYRQEYKGTHINKYYSGTSVAMLPFFALAHWYTKHKGGDADGYSKYYQIAISWAAIIYMLLSLILMAKTLKLYRISDQSIAFGLVLVVFATNWYHYVVSEPAMSHVYSIFFITWFVYLIARWNTKGKVSLPLVAAILAVIILLRPLNGIVLLLVPGLFRDWTGFISKCKLQLRKPQKLIIALFIGAAILSIQFIIYYFQTGELFIYAYKEEGFNFRNPQIINILFSYKKGLFVYTPMLFIALWGLYSWFKKNTWQAIWTFSFLAVLTYFLSSWWMWYYGGSFSSRVYIEYFVLFLIPLGYLLDGIKKAAGRHLIHALLIFTLILSQFQTYQYRKMVIHWDGMTKEKYWESFTEF
ncbi:MAG: hypothetical protein ACI8ZN_000481 [Bacteroidia bacterium]|jgi:hypothetical protein